MSYDASFNAYLAAGGDPKKFPKRPQRKPAASAAKNPLEMIMRAVGGHVPKVKGNLADYKKARGLRSVYRLPDGTFVDSEWKKVEPPKGSVFVPLKK